MKKDEKGGVTTDTTEMNNHHWELLWTAICKTNKQKSNPEHIKPKHNKLIKQQNWLRMRLDSYLSPVRKINLKWIKDLPYTTMIV